MKTPYRNTAFRLTALASAIALASASAWAAASSCTSDAWMPPMTTGMPRFLNWAAIS